MPTPKVPSCRNPRQIRFNCILLFTVFLLATSLSSAQTLTTLYSFCAEPNCVDGLSPRSPLVQASDGNFYGTTLDGGAEQIACNGGCGTVFKITPSGAFSTIYSFCSQQNCADGAEPGAGLIQANDGALYGTTQVGGTHSQGTVFKITPDGSLTTVHNFCSQANCADGALSAAALIQVADGSLYGTTERGGIHNSRCGTGGCGTIFRISPSGAFSVLYSFCSLPSCVDGAGPQAALLQASDENFYGTTNEGGANGLAYGTAFRITPGGTLTTLYSFCAERDCADGAFPIAPLIQARDGSLWGTTTGGGLGLASGTIFRISPSGTLAPIYYFCSLPQCSDGESPNGALLQGRDGNFYGTTGSGAPGRGTAYMITSGGNLTTVYRFCASSPPTSCPDGQGPGGLIQGIDGNLYGVTGGGGAHDFYGNGGTVFRLTGPAPSASQFVPVTSCRLVDTRQTHTPLQAGTWQNFVVPQLGECNIPSTATAFSLNVTAVPSGQLRYLTVWPAQTPRPSVSTLNSFDGRTKANAAIVTAGASEAVSVYASDDTDLILDIDGYFTAPGSQTLQFYPLAPCRVIDTRGADGDLGGPHLLEKTERDFPVLESSCIPSGVNITAYSMNVTVVPYPSGQPLSYLTVWPQGESRPTASTLNNPTATSVANAAIVPAGTGGGIAVYPFNTTDLIVDINGYFAAPSTGGYSFYATPQCRAFDSRNNNGHPFTGELTVNVATGMCAAPGNAGGYVFNATVVPSGPLGFLTLWANPGQQPLASTLNASDGLPTSNMAIVPNTDGFIDAFAGNGYTQLILDLSGYFAP
jgi:uncharacterized repeat protein (TIGR03803 family)